MASDTAPAAVPAPTSPPGPAPATAPEQPAGGLAGLLSAIDPVRSDPLSFHLPDSATDLHAAAGTGGAGASSADFDHDPASPKQSASKDSSTAQETRIWRAWMLAGAERWRKGADARNKALDIRKAQAQALQIKRAETVNRSEKIVGGNTSTGSRTDAGKSSSSKTSNSGGPKGNSGTGGTGSGGGGGGRSGGSSRGPAGGGSGGGAGRGQSGTHRKDTKNANGGSGSGAGGKGWKDNATHKSAGGGKDVKNGPAGGGKGSHVEHKTARETPPDRTRTPKADKTPTAPKPAKTDTTTRTTKTDKAAPPAGSPGADKNTSRTPKAGKETDTCGKASGIDLTKDKKSKGADGKTTPPSSPTPDGTAKAPDAKSGTKTPPTLKKDSQGRPDTPKPGAGKPGSGGPSVNTQPSREAGHRDGIRLGKAVSHAEAYKDGLRDGYRDTRTVAAQEKDRLDKAHAARKTPPPPPGPVVPPKPTAPPKPDLTKPDRDKPTPKDQPMTATPVQVKSINANTLELGNGAARPTINRGEVRTLRNYQNRLKDKTDIMNQVAETTRVLEQHAIEQAKKVINLVELAKGVRGGDKLNAALAKLEEAAKTQAAQAAAINQRATRAADACTALSANVETRYGDMYKAVVNSPETVPAELAYYQEMSNA